MFVWPWKVIVSSPASIPASSAGLPSDHVLHQRAGVHVEAEPLGQLRPEVSVSTPR